MKFLNVKKDIFEKEALTLYKQNDIERQYDRYLKLDNEHISRYGETEKFISSPGRIELLGNHTDHNNGKVLCAAISVDTLCAVTKRNDNKVFIKSEGYDEFSVDLSKLDKVDCEEGTSKALVRGVADYFVKNGAKIGGFSATVTSDVFKGAGVSSSASFELAIAEIFNVFYNDGKFDAIYKATASQYAENYHFGKPCGLMDQSAIALGGVSYIDFKDTKNPIVQSYNWNFSRLAIALVNTGGDHSDLTSHYASIREEMNAVASNFNKRVLREIEYNDFINAIPSLINKVNDRAIMRAIHYYNENSRVEKGRDCVQNGDQDGFVDMINGSGNSSYKLLQNCYVPSSTEQRVPLALAIANTADGYVTARVHGGGFGGTILCVIENEETKINNFVSAMAKVFGGDNVFSIEIRNSGAREVKLC